MALIRWASIAFGSKMSARVRLNCSTNMEFSPSVNFGPMAMIDPSPTRVIAMVFISRERGIWPFLRASSTRLPVASWDFS